MSGAPRLDKEISIVEISRSILTRTGVTVTDESLDYAKALGVLGTPYTSPPDRDRALDVMRLSLLDADTQRRLLGVYDETQGREILEALAERRAIQVEAREAELRPRLRVVTSRELLEMSIPPREFIVEPIIQTQGTAMLYSPRGMGKTRLGLALSVAVAAGSTFLKWRVPIRRRVLYVDGEMPAADMQQRLAGTLASFGADVEPDYLRLLLYGLQAEGIPNISTVPGQRLIEDQLGQTELLILDSISTLSTQAKENEAESWMPIQEWILYLRRRGISVLFLHHAGKDGQQRGTSKREDIIDTTIALRHPCDYREEQGTRFEVHYEKSRGFYGKQAEPFEVEMRVENGIDVWMMRDLEALNDSRAKEMFGNGLSVRDVAGELRISSSSAGRLRKRLGF